MLLKSFVKEGPYHMQTGPLICFANQWNGFYMIRTSATNELKICILNIWYGSEYLKRISIGYSGDTYSLPMAVLLVDWVGK